MLHNPFVLAIIVTALLFLMHRGYTEIRAVVVEVAPIDDEIDWSKYSVREREDIEDRLRAEARLRENT